MHHKIRPYKLSNGKKILFIVTVTLTFDLMTPKYIGFFPFHREIMWSSLVKIQYKELKLSCGNDPVVNNSIYSYGDLDLWPNDPKINRFLPLLQENHVVMFGKDPMYGTKVIVRKPVWTSARPPPARRPPAIPNHIIRPVSRRAYKKIYRAHHWLYLCFHASEYLLTHGRPSRGMFPWNRSRTPQQNQLKFSFLVISGK